MPGEPWSGAAVFGFLASVRALSHRVFPSAVFRAVPGPLRGDGPRLPRTTRFRGPALPGPPPTGPPRRALPCGLSAQAARFPGQSAPPRVGLRVLRGRGAGQPAALWRGRSSTRRGAADHPAINGWERVGRWANPLLFIELPPHHGRCSSGRQARRGHHSAARPGRRHGPARGAYRRRHEGPDLGPPRRRRPGERPSARAARDASVRAGQARRGTRDHRAVPLSAPGAAGVRQRSVSSCCCAALRPKGGGGLRLPLGTNIEKKTAMGDFWMPHEVRALAARDSGDKQAYWLPYKQYSVDARSRSSGNESASPSQGRARPESDPGRAGPDPADRRRCPRRLQGPITGSFVNRRV